MGRPSQSQMHSPSPARSRSISKLQAEAYPGRTPPAAPTGRRRALDPASASCAPAHAASSLVVSSPASPSPGRASGLHPRWSCPDWRWPRAAVRETSAGHASPLRTCRCAVALAGAGSLQTHFRLFFAKIVIVGIAPPRPRSWAGKALGRRMRRRGLKPSGRGLGEVHARSLGVVMEK